MSEPNICPLCEEPTLPGEDISPATVWVYNGTGEPRSHETHRACSLREVIGGIGHLIAHDYWCTERHDPDAGLTRRQSALLVDAFVNLVGIEEAATRGQE